MQINFRAIVEEKKLPASTPLLPLFEAIVNSIQSINEANLKEGSICVNVIRDVTPLGSVCWETDIDSFEIIDNGVGFNEKNYSSFDIYGSDHKLALGCKGVGRVQWLRAFSSVEVESTYLGNDGKYYDRKFDFSILNERREIEHQESMKESNETKVSLCNFFHRYRVKCPKKIDTLARDIMDHCFTYLALDACPQITIKDEQESKNINTLFKEHTKGHLHSVDFEIKGIPFKIIGAKNYAPSNGKHILHFCAHNREVSDENENIKELSGKLTNSDGDFVYSGYITGDLLDASINSDRTAFLFTKIEPKEEDEQSSEEQLALEGTENGTIITKRDIIKAALHIVNEFLGDEIATYNRQKKERVEKYVYGINPRYRSLIKHNGECLDKIPLTNDDDKLELELFKQEQQYRLRLKQEQQIVLSEDINSSSDFDYTSKCDALLQKTSDLGKDDLADYIIHRKVMLSILEHTLAYTDEEKKRYALEKNIHSLIFPMITTSDDIEYDRHNLWIIDERLAYHYYLASDMSISSYEDTCSDSTKEPDITIFEPAFAMTGDPKDSDANNVTIIEFKRPGRTDKECVDQVVRYVKQIREGRAKDKSGRILGEVNGKSIRFSCYVLCDINASMTEFLEGRGFKKTPDGRGFYLPHDNYNATIEVIPYSKLIKDSIRRNKILFDRLFNQ